MVRKLFLAKDSFANHLLYDICFAGGTELAAFRHLQIDEKQNITFLPVQLGRVLFANAVAMTVWALPHALFPIYGPWFGIDYNHVSTDTYNNVSMISYPFFMWTMYECQKYAAARDLIDEQMETFSIERAECFDEKDRPRVEREIAKWFGDGDRATGIAKFDDFVRKDIRKLVEGMIGRRKWLSAEIPWAFILLSSTAAILEDVGGLASLFMITDRQVQLVSFFSCSSCLLVGTPTMPIFYIWFSSKRFREFLGGWPMVLAAPICGMPSNYLLIVGSLSSDFTFCCVQYCLSLAFGAFVFRDSLSQLLGLQNQGEVRIMSKKQKAFAMLPSQEN